MRPNIGCQAYSRCLHLQSYTVEEGKAVELAPVDKCLSVLDSISDWFVPLAESISDCIHMQHFLNHHHFVL